MNAQLNPRTQSQVYNTKEQVSEICNHCMQLLYYSRTSVSSWRQLERVGWKENAVCTIEVKGLDVEGGKLGSGWKQLDNTALYV